MPLICEEGTHGRTAFGEDFSVGIPALAIAFSCPIGQGARATQADVRFGLKADMCNAPTYVRFTPNSDRKSRHQSTQRLTDGGQTHAYFLLTCSAHLFKILLSYEILQVAFEVRRGGQWDCMCLCKTHMQEAFLFLDGF
jgi:hypothetical protein